MSKIQKVTIIDHLSNMIVNDGLLSMYSEQQLLEHYPEVMKYMIENPESESSMEHKLYWSALCSIHQSLLGSVIDGFNYSASTKDVPEQPLNDPSKVLDFEIDNRDLNCTWLRLTGSDKRVDIDPVEMFRNALENSGMSSTEVSTIIDQAMSRIDEINNQE